LELALESNSQLAIAQKEALGQTLEIG